MGKNTKKIVITAVVAMMVLGLVSAALLTYFATMVGSATVNQSLVVDGHDWDNPIEYDIGCVAGNTYTNGPFVIENRANQAISIGFETTPTWYNNTSATWEDASDAVTTRYLAELKLENKNSTWAPITDDGIEATLTYELNSPKFNYKFEATGLSANTEYDIIYYADQPDRYENWGGDNPGKLIDTFTTESRNYSGVGSVNLAMNLPKEPDANIQEYDYCKSDNYLLCHGAKIWIVPSSDYNESTRSMSGWNPSNYLFETDMLTYDDTDTDEGGLNVGHGKFNLYIENTFNPLARSGDYEVKTNIVPK